MLRVPSDGVIYSAEKGSFVLTTPKAHPAFVAWDMKEIAKSSTPLSSSKFTGKYNVSYDVAKESSLIEGGYESDSEDFEDAEAESFRNYMKSRGALKVSSVENKDNLNRDSSVGPTKF